MSPCLLAVLLATLPADAPAAPHRVYSHLIAPREHPDDARRAVKPPGWDTFGNRTRFTCLRGFGVEGDRIVGHVEELDRYTRKHQLGEVIWPSYPILFAKNLGDLADEIKRRDLFLFDIWGYVPGSGPGGYWTQFKPPAEAFATLTTRLGDRWLGTDIGEQDGRYIGGYANQMTPASADRLEQYFNFQRHFERMSDDLGHRHATLVSLNYGHYLLKEGTFTLIGAETAQALPNNQVYYAFIRGAGKQYGVPWFGNASIYNRWGYKTYGSSGGSGGDTHGPTRGSSVSLLRRLLYSHILYNSVAVGFEAGWFDGDKLSPIGRVQQSARKWVAEHGQPGVLHTPVAILLDFNAGWTFPRHLYTDHIFRVWGNLPYDQRDHFTDAVLDLLYPGYADSSYFHDETGFITPTPYGDIADCILSDAEPWLLDRYAVIVVAAASLEGGLDAKNMELHDKLFAYARRGGHLVTLPQGDTPFLDPVRMEPASAIVPIGKGKITELTSHGLEARTLPRQTLRSEVDRPLPRPYTLRAADRNILDRIFREQQLFDAGDPDLTLITCRKGPGSYTVGLFNNGWKPRPFQVTSRIGTIQSIRELPIDDESKSVGFVPEGVDPNALGHNTATTIAGGDVRIFDVRVQETGVEEIPHVAPPPRGRRSLLTLRRTTSIKEEILARPTFFEHREGVVVDWRYVHEREAAALDAETGWIGRQGLRVMVDLSSGVDLYPTLRLIDNDRDEYARSMAVIGDVIAKMKRLPSRDLIVSLHRYPENNFEGAQTHASFVATLKRLAADAAKQNVTIHLRQALGKPPWSLGELGKLVDEVGAPNLKIAASTALLTRAGHSPAIDRVIREKLGLWLFATTSDDLAGTPWNAHDAVISNLPGKRGTLASEALVSWLALRPDVSLVSDAIHINLAGEYLEAKAIDELLHWPPAR